MRKFQLFFIIGILLFLLRCSTDNRSKKDKILRIAYFGELLHKNPQLSTDIGTTALLYPLYHSLFSYDKEGKLIPDLISSYKWETSTIFKFRIKKSVFFKNGQRVDEKTVIDNLKYFYDKKRNFPYASEYEFIKDVYKKGNEIIIELKKPFAPLLSYLTISIIPPSRLGKDDKFPESSKGFEILSYKEGKSFFIKKGRKIFEFYFIKDNLTALLKLKKGEVDVIAGYKFKKDISDKRISQALYKFNMLYYFVFNTMLTKLNSFEKRSCILNCININSLYKGLKGKAYHSYYPFVNSKYFKETDYLSKGNIKERECGLKKLSLLINSESELKKLYAIILKEELKKCGINLNIISLEYSSYLKRLKGRNFETAIGGYVFDSDLSRKDIWHSKGVMNYSGLNNPEIDKLIEEGIAETSREKRIEIYKKLYSIIREYKPLLFLPTPYFKVYYRKGVKLKIPFLIHSNSSVFTFLENWDKN